MPTRQNMLTIKGENTMTFAIAGVVIMALIIIVPWLLNRMADDYAFDDMLMQRQKLIGFVRVAFVLLMIFALLALIALYIST